MTSKKAATAGGAGQGHGAAQNRERQRRLKMFSEFLEKKYIEWRRQRIQEEPEYSWTRGDWAQYLDLGEPQLSMYFSGFRWPRPETIEQLALRLGDSVYEILGLTPPDRQLLRLEELWASLSPEARARIDVILDEETGAGPESGAKDTGEHNATGGRSNSDMEAPQGGMGHAKR